MKKTPKKLTLSRETLRHLHSEQSKDVLGGDTTLTTLKDPPPTSDSVRVCCAD
jgi:hypothetical protein